MWRLLGRIDGAALDRAVGRWSADRRVEAEGQLQAAGTADLCCDGRFSTPFPSAGMFRAAATRFDKRVYVFRGIVTVAAIRPRP